MTTAREGHARIVLNKDSLPSLDEVMDAAKESACGLAMPDASPMRANTHATPVESIRYSALNGA